MIPAITVSSILGSWVFWGAVLAILFGCIRALLESSNAQPSYARQTWEVKLLEKQVRMLRYQWNKDEELVLFGPEAAYYGGKTPTAKENIRGALGLLCNELVFRSDDKYEVRLSFSEMRWVERGSHFYPANIPDEWAPFYAISIHCEKESEWQVHVFFLNGALQLIEMLHERSIPYWQNIGEWRPIQLKTYVQDIYGHWQADSQHTVYLAPDRLLFDWQRSLHYSQFRSLTLLDSWQPNESLLRLDYDSGDNKPQIIGLAFRYINDAESWADALHRLTDVPYEHLAGRKKKSAKETIPPAEM